METNLLQLDLLNSFCGPINLREVTIIELRNAFLAHQITCKELTATYLKRIEVLNPSLNAIIEINPDALAIAQDLDEEFKRTGQLRRFLHGIPILIKDNIGTCDKTETCAGSLALLGLKPKEDSEIVKRLRAAGAVILGKANMSEFANFRGANMPDGWSGRGNQTSNAYIIGATPSGSSSGSAVAVAANLAVVSLGSETDGSIISPCSLACVVGLKPTVGLVPSKGVVPLSFSQDSVGPIARTVTDAAILYDIISDTKSCLECFNINKPSFHCCVEATFKVGVLRTPFWQQVSEDAVTVLEKAVDALKCTGIHILDPVPNSEQILEGVSRDHEMLAFRHEFKSGINEYLNNDVKPIDSRASECNHVQCLKDIIIFNEENPTSEGYDQAHLEMAQATTGIQDETYKELCAKNISAARKIIDDYLKNNELDAFVIPSDSIGILAAVAGYPIITVPTGFHSNGIPFGIAFFGTANSEAKLLQIAFRLESVFKARMTSLFKPLPSNLPLSS